MKVLLLLSLLLVVCYSHTKLRTNSPTDQPQLDLQLSKADNQINLIGQSQSLEVNPALATAAVQTALRNGLSKVYQKVKDFGDLRSDIIFNEPPVVVSITSQTRNSSIVSYTFVVNQEDRRGNTLRSVFTIPPAGGSDLLYFDYYAQNVSTSSTSPDFLRPVNSSLQAPDANPTSLTVNNSILQQAYNKGLESVKQIAASRGDIPSVSNLFNNIISIQYQQIGNETAYLFNVQSNSTNEVILYSSFTVTQRAGNLFFTDFAYNVQKNQYGSALPQTVELLEPGAENRPEITGAYQFGLNAVERIAKADGHLAASDSFAIWRVSSTQRQITRNTYSYTFQANVNSTAGVVFTVTFAVSVANTSYALTAYAYSELRQASYSAIPDDLLPRNISDVDDDILTFGIQALIQVATDLGHVRNFVSSARQVVQFYSQHNNNNDNTYVFVFNTTDSRSKVVIAASISVVVRGTQRILSGYAYNILSANSTTVVSSALENIDYRTVVNNADVKDSLTAGLEGLKAAAIQKGDLGEGVTFPDVKVNNTLQKSTIGFDYTYIFRVEITTNTGTTLGAVLSVTYRAVDARRYLAAYAYNLQNATLYQVLPSNLINLNVQLAVNDPLIRSYVGFGINSLISIAVNKTDLPVGFVLVGDPTVTSIQRQTIGSDVGFLFQVSFTGSPNITVAAGFTIIIRASGSNATILSTYAYTVLTTRLTQVLAQPAVEVANVQTALTSVSSLQDAVAYGLDQLLLIAVNRRDLRTSDSWDQSSRVINRVLNQTTGNDFAYIFNVTINTNSGVNVSASLSVTTRATSGRPILVLSGYAYIVQNSALTRVNPTPLVDQSTTIQNPSGLKDLLDYGVGELIRIAKLAGNLAASFPSAPAVTVTRIQNSTTGNDVTYVFDFGVSDQATRIRFAAIISITLRAATSERVLNYFAYSVLYSNVSSLLPQDYESRNVNEASVGLGRELLNYGVGEVIQILKNNGVVDNQFQNNKTQVISVQRQIVDGDTSYAYQVLVNNERGLILGAAITVTRRTVPTTSNILVNYAYNLQNTTGKAVGTNYSNYLSSAQVSDQTVQDFLNTGAQFIQTVAKDKGYIANSVNLNSVTPISAQALNIGSNTRGYQFQANLDNGDQNSRVTVSATFTVLQIGSGSPKVVSNYQYNVQTVYRNNASN